MAGFGIFCNGTVVLYKVLCIFVKAWWCIFATFLSRKTLYETIEQQTLKKIKKQRYEINQKKISSRQQPTKKERLYLYF